MSDGKASAIDWGWVLAYGSAGEAPIGVAVVVGALVLAIVASRFPQRAARPA